MPFTEHELNVAEPAASTCTPNTGQRLTHQPVESCHAFLDACRTLNGFGDRCVPARATQDQPAA